MAEQDISLKKFEEHETQQRQVFKEKVFTGEDVNGVTFNQISFLSCKFDGGKITNCNFNKCEFNSCDFNNAKFSNCEFDDTTYIGESEFNGTEFMDVTIKGNLSKNSFSPTCKVKNLIINGKEIKDISQITSIVETVNEAVETEAAGLDPEIDELPSRANLDDDLKIYRVIFPELMKKYPAIEKAADSTPEYPGYQTFVGNIEFAFAQDEGGWRVMFFIKGTDDCLCSNTVHVPSDREITFDTCKEAFENEVKGTAAIAANRSGSEVIKRDLNEFIKLVFNTAVENVETICSFVVDGSDKVEDVRGTFNSGYDMVNKKNCIIVGKPFTSSNIAEAKEVSEQIKKYGFILKEDIDSKSAEQIETYAKENPYSCFVLEQDVARKVTIKPFKKNSIVVIK